MAIFTRQATEGEEKFFKGWTYWECGVSEFDHIYDHDETCVVYEGHAEIRCDGETVTLKPHVLAFFPKGSETHWKIIEPVTKYFR